MRLPRPLTWGYGLTPRGGGFTGHDHAGHDEIGLVAHHATTIRRGGFERSAEPGTVFLFQRGELHGYRNACDQEPHLWLAQFEVDEELYRACPRLAQPIELPAGGEMFFNYGVAHANGPNTTDHERAGLALHFLQEEHLGRSVGWSTPTEVWQRRIGVGVMAATASTVNFCAASGSTCQLVDEGIFVAIAGQGRSH